MAHKDNRRELFALVKRYGFVLYREKKHYIFKHSSGALLTCSKSSLDKHYLLNIKSVIKRLLLSS